MWWWGILVSVFLVGMYAYSMSSRIQIAKPGCSTCPHQNTQTL